MVTYLLSFSAVLVNVTNLKPNDPRSLCYYLKLKCSSCGDVASKDVCISLEETIRVSPSSMVHLIRQCKTCKESGSLSMVIPPNQETNDDGLTIRMSRKQELAPLMLLKMDNCEPVDGDTYSNLDLSGDVALFDEEDGTRGVIAKVKCSFDVVAPPQKIKKTGKGRKRFYREALKEKKRITTLIG
ncbi:UPF0587 protein [Tanacetum coccineum]